MHRIAALLLAAGFGRRFDKTGQTSKLLARIGDAGVAHRSATALAQAGLPVYAVVRPAPLSLHQELLSTGAQLIVSQRAELGMGFSIADGIIALQQAEPSLDGVLICLADMPFIEPATYLQVAGSLNASHPIVAAACDGRRGHPVGFWHTEFARLATLDGDNGAGRLLKTHNPLLIETGSPTVLQDIDQPDDLPPVACD